MDFSALIRKVRGIALACSLLSAVLLGLASCSNVFDLENHASVEIKKETPPVEEPSDKTEPGKDTGAEEDEKEPELSAINPPSPLSLTERHWTILLYMSADNDLEAAAMEDLCEMEFSSLNTDQVTVLALVDRSPAYDTSCDNWYGSRLYKIQTGREADCRTLISTELECRDLGLSLGKETELDMSSSYVLSSALIYVRKRYPANHYGLVIWGHGTGWRSGSENAGAAGSAVSRVAAPVKGFSFDSTSGTYMTLCQIGEGIRAGLNGVKLDFLGFDTCYGGEIEVLYELKDYAKYFAGSAGLIDASGWNYEGLFSEFQNCREKTAEDLCGCVISQFKNQYAYKSKAGIFCADMGKFSEYFDTCEAMWKNAASKIVNTDSRDSLMKALYSGLNCKVKRYSYGGSGSDIYLDIASMMEAIFGLYNCKALYEKYLAAESALFFESWASDSDQAGAGVYFSTLNDSNNLCFRHPLAYVKGETSQQILFVRDSQGYVPTQNGGKSLLDKLFYFN